MQIPKNKPFRSKKAIEWFRNQPCHFTGESREGFVTGHHEGLNGSGVATKCPDDEQIPMSFELHRERHDIGRESFYKKYEVEDWRELVEIYKMKYHMEKS